MVKGGELKLLTKTWRSLLGGHTKEQWDKEKEEDG